MINFFEERRNIMSKNQPLQVMMDAIDFDHRNIQTSSKYISFDMIINTEIICDIYQNQDQKMVSLQSYLPVKAAKLQIGLKLIDKDHSEYVVYPSHELVYPFTKEYDQVLHLCHVLQDKIRNKS